MPRDLATWRGHATYSEGMKKPSFLLALLFAAAPALAQSPDGWLRDRDMLLGPTRNYLMSIRGTGRKANRTGSSYFADVAPRVD